MPRDQSDATRKPRAADDAGEDQGDRGRGDASADDVALTFVGSKDGFAAVTGKNWDDLDAAGREQAIADAAEKQTAAGDDPDYWGGQKWEDLDDEARRRRVDDIRDEQLDLRGSYRNATGRDWDEDTPEEREQAINDVADAMEKMKLPSPGGSEQPPDPTAGLPSVDGTAPPPPTADDPMSPDQSGAISGGAAAGARAAAGVARFGSGGSGSGSGSGTGGSGSGGAGAGMGTGAGTVAPPVDYDRWDPSGSQPTGGGTGGDEGGDTAPGGDQDDNPTPSGDDDDSNAGSTWEYEGKEYPIPEDFYDESTDDESTDDETADDGGGTTDDDGATDDEGDAADLEYTPAGDTATGASPAWQWTTQASAPYRDWLRQAKAGSTVNPTRDGYTEDLRGGSLDTGPGVSDPPRGENGHVGDPEDPGPDYNDPNVGAVDPSPLDGAGGGGSTGPEDDPAGALDSLQQGPLKPPEVDSGDDDGSSDATDSYPPGYNPPGQYVYEPPAPVYGGGDAGEILYEDPFAPREQWTPPEEEPLIKGPGDDDGLHHRGDVVDDDSVIDF